MSIFDYVRTLPELVGPYRSALLLLGAAVFVIAGLAWGAMRLMEAWLDAGDAPLMAPPAAPGPKHRRVS